MALLHKDAELEDAIQGLDLYACRQYLKQLQVERSLRQEHVERLEEKLKTTNQELCSRQVEAEKRKLEFFAEQEINRRRADRSSKKGVLSLHGDPHDDGAQVIEQWQASARNLIERELQMEMSNQQRIERTPFGFKEYEGSRLMVFKPEAIIEQERGLRETVLVTYAVPHAEKQYHQTYRVAKDTTIKNLKADACAYWGLSEVEFVLKTMGNSKPCDAMKVVDSLRKDEEAHFVLVQKAPKNITLLDKEYSDILPKQGRRAQRLRQQLEEKEATTSALPGADGSLAEQMVIFPGLYQFMTQRDKDIKQHLQRTKLRSICVYFILALLSASNVYLLRPPGDGYACTQGVLELLTGDVHSKPMKTIRDVPEIWDWLEKTLVAEVLTDNSTLRQSNYLVGYLQVLEQQVAVPSALQCRGIEASDGSFSCMDVKYEETKVLQKEDELLKNYWQNKLGEDGRSITTKPWQHHHPPFSTSGSAPKASSFAPSDASGFRLEYNLQHSPLSDVREAFLQDMAFLRSEGWLSVRTRALHISFVSYNAAYLTWIWNRFTFELSAFGTIHALPNVQLYRPRVFDYGLEISLAFTDITRFVMLLYVFFQIYWDFRYVQAKSGAGWKHLLTSQALVDATMIILFIIVFALRASYLGSDSTVGYTVSHVNSFQDAGQMAEYYSLHTTLDTILLALCVYRFFYFLRVNRQVFILWATVHRAFQTASRLVLLLALPVLVAFVLCHMAVTGASLESGRNFGATFARTLILFFGDNTTVAEYEPNRFYELAYNVGLFYMGRLVIANTWTAILMQEYQKMRVTAGYDPKHYRWKEFDWASWVLPWPLKGLYLRLRPSIRPVKRFHDDDSLE